jgi:hypothetical protein
MLDDLHSLIAELERDDALEEPGRLRERIEALDQLEGYGLESLGQAGGAEAEIRARLYSRARAIYARLEALNGEFYTAIRRDIQRGAGAARLLEWAPAIGQAGDGYDHLDVLVNGVLQLAQPGAEIAEPAAEMVFYQPTPARHIFELIARAGLSERDILLDLGSGMGHVPLVTAICTGAQTIGVELEAAYVDCARRSARELNLNNVSFVQQDARAADLSRASLFYLYTPFSGTILRDVLAALRHEAARREIRICTYGPCTPTVAEERWLEPDGPPQTDRIAVFQPRR